MLSKAKILGKQSSRMRPLTDANASTAGTSTHSSSTSEDVVDSDSADSTSVDSISVDSLSESSAKWSMMILRQSSSRSSKVVGSAVVNVAQSGSNGTTTATLTATKRSADQDKVGGRRGAAAMISCESEAGPSLCVLKFSANAQGHVKINSECIQ